MRKLPNLIAALAVLVVTPLAAQDDPAALVIRLQGDVQVRHGGADAAAAVVGERLMAGDEVLPASGSRAFLITRSGAALPVTEAHTVAAPQGAVRGDMFDRALQTLAQAATTDARTAGGRQGMIRPIPGEPVLVAPRNSLTVTARRPTFSWMAVDGATGYTIQVRRVEPAGDRPMRFDVGNATEWTWPEDAEELTAGAEYAWTVAPTRGRPTREQRFHVIDPTGMSELESYLDQVSEMGLDPQGDGLFLTAMIYRDMDLFYDAAGALEVMEETGDMSADLYLLKGEILNYLGRGEEAQAAFDKADELMR